MRTRNSIINIVVSCGSYVFLMLNSFLTRAVFARELGLAYVGIDGLFLNIISMLAIVELGIGTGIVYKLYAPIADGDKHKVAILLNFYKKAYFVIGLVMLGLGIAAAGASPYLVKGAYSKLWLSFIFLFYVFDVLSSYLYAHKRALFTASQKNYVNTISHTVCQALSCILQVVTLILFRSFVLYLIIKVAMRLLENIIIAQVYRRYFQDINLKTKEQMPSQEKRDLFQNIKAMFLHRIAGFCVISTSSMIISYGAGIVTNGIYSNYLLITNGMVNLTNQLFNGIVASFGDLLATSTKEKAFENFKVIYFINYLIYSFLSIALFVCVTPFVSKWIGPQGVLPIVTTLLIALYFYMTGMRQSVYMVRMSAGIYQPDRYLAILEAVINIGLAVFLVKPLGINGVLVANLVSLMCVPFWTQPYIAYKLVMQQSLWVHYRRYLLYFGLLLMSGTLTWFLCGLIPCDNMLGQLFVNMVIAVLVPNAINVVLFCRTREFLYLVNMGKQLLCKLTGRKEPANQ